MFNSLPGAGGEESVRARSQESKVCSAQQQLSKEVVILSMGGLCEACDLCGMYSRALYDCDIMTPDI